MGSETKRKWLVILHNFKQGKTQTNLINHVMLGEEALEADEETLEGQILQGKTTKMNGTNGKNGGASSDVKYPANCAMRLSSTPGSDGDDNDPYEPKQNKKIVRILTVMVYVFTVSFGAILLSLYYLFLWDPYKNTGQPPTQIPHAQANSPPTPSPSSTTTPTSPQVSNSPSNTLSDSALDNIVEDLNNGAQPKALAMAMRVLKQKESLRNERHLHTNPYKYLSKAHRAST